MYAFVEGVGKLFFSFLIPATKLLKLAKFWYQPFAGLVDAQCVLSQPSPSPSQTVEKTSRRILFGAVKTCLSRVISCNVVGIWGG